MNRFTTDSDLEKEGYVKTEFKSIETVRTTYSGELIMINHYTKSWAILDEKFDEKNDRVLRLVCFIRDDKIIATHV